MQRLILRVLDAVGPLGHNVIAAAIARIARLRAAGGMFFNL